MKTLLIIFILTLNACTLKTSTKPQTDKTSPPIVSRSTDATKTSTIPLLQYARAFNEMTNSAQKSELASVSAKSKSDTHSRNKTAIIYALPNSSLHDDNKALILLDNLNEDSTLSTEDAYFLKILRTYVQERIKNQQKISDEQKRSDAYSQKNELLQQKTESLQAQLKLLEQKLEALKNIEKNMLNRDQGAH